MYMVINYSISPHLLQRRVLLHEYLPPEAVEVNGELHVVAKGGFSF